MVVLIAHCTAIEQSSCFDDYKLQPLDASLAHLCRTVDERLRLGAGAGHVMLPITGSDLLVDILGRYATSCPLQDISLCRYLPSRPPLR